LFEKLFARIGIGSATVDLEVPKPLAELGETLNGEIKIKGGNLEQQVDKIAVNLMLKSLYSEGGQNRPVNKIVETAAVVEGLTVQPEQELIIPISFKIPFSQNLPVSRGRTSYYLQIALDIPKAIDPVDHDEIVILPCKYLKMLFDAIANLGFRETDDSGDYNGRYQEFEYQPTTFFVRELDKIRIYPISHKEELAVALLLDKKEKGYLGSLLHDAHLDERSVTFKISYENMKDADKVTKLLKEVIEEEYKKI